MALRRKCSFYTNKKNGDVNLHICYTLSLISLLFYCRKRSQARLKHRSRQWIPVLGLYHADVLTAQAQAQATACRYCLKVRNKMVKTFRFDVTYLGTHVCGQPENK